MYIVAYYIVFAMGNESTIANSKYNQILYYRLRGFPVTYP